MENFKEIKQLKETTNNNINDLLMISFNSYVVALHW